MTRLTRKQEIFIQEYLKDLNAAGAAARAGYSPVTAKQEGYRLLNKPHVKEAIEIAMEDRIHKILVDAEWVLRQLVKVYETCSETYETDTTKKLMNPQVATRALELIGKHLNMFGSDAVHVNVNNPVSKEVDAAREKLRKLPEESRRRIFELIRTPNSTGEGTA